MPTDSDASQAAGVGTFRSYGRWQMIGLLAELVVLTIFLVSPPPADMSLAAGVVGLMGV